MALQTVHALRYVLPLREGGSMPLLVEADDDKSYVAKMRGAGQGPLALVAEIITGEIARSLGLPVPRIALVDVDETFGRVEPDPEIQDIFRSSHGINAGLEFLTEATVFDPASGDVADADLASLVVWLDAFTLNVDRTPRNANLIVQRGAIWLIDHGASLFFHHDWPTAQAKATSPFSYVREHILLPWASRIPEAAEQARSKLTPTEIDRILHLVPDEWLVREAEETSASQRRTAYAEFLKERLKHASIFEQEALRARS